MEAKFWNSVGSIPVEGNSLSIGEWIAWPPEIQYKQRNLNNAGDLTGDLTMNRGSNLDLISYR